VLDFVTASNFGFGAAAQWPVLMTMTTMMMMMMIRRQWKQWKQWEQWAQMSSQQSSTFVLSGTECHQN
jgi:hypothetical protein